MVDSFDYFLVDTMEITFASEAARNIYDRIMGRSAEEGRPEVADLFRLAARSGNAFDDIVLDEKEAQRVEEALNRYDRGLFVSLGIGFYDEEEINNAVNEYEAWFKCRTEEFYGDGLKAINSFESFIQNFPDSENIPEAYFRLGFLHMNIRKDYDRAIESYEELLRLFPQSTLASEALGELINLSSWIGKDEQAFLYSNQWLARRAYTPTMSFYSPPPTYKEAKNEVLFFQAEYYKSRAEYEMAASIYRSIVASGAGYYSEIAEGALEELESPAVYTESRQRYTENKIDTMIMRARYILYERHDLATAEGLYQEILRLAEEAGLSNPAVTGAEMALEEIKLRNIRTSSEALSAILDLKKRDKINDFFEYYDVFPKIHMESLRKRICSFCFCMHALM